MKSLQKFVLPILVLAAIVLIYLTYFKPTKDLGDFSNFDPNNTANKEIRVQLVAEKGISQQQGASVFYVVDKDGQEVMISGPANLPPDVESAETLILMGHLHNEYFHASSVTAD